MQSAAAAQVRAEGQHGCVSSLALGAASPHWALPHVGSKFGQLLAVPSPEMLQGTLREVTWFPGGI